MDPSRPAIHPMGANALRICLPSNPSATARQPARAKLVQNAELIPFMAPVMGQATSLMSLKCSQKYPVITESVYFL